MKTFLKVFLGAFLAFIVFANPFKSCHPAVEPDSGGLSPSLQKAPAPMQLDTEVAQKVYYTDMQQIKIPKAIAVQNEVPQNYTEVPLPVFPQAAPAQGDIGQQKPQNPWDSLINGGLGVGVLGLLAFVVKSDRETLKKFNDVLDKIADSNGDIKEDIKELLEHKRREEKRIEATHYGQPPK